MAQLPGLIRYNERTPSGEIGAVPTNNNFDTGGQGVARALYEIGGVLSDYANKVKQQEINTEFYEKKRLIAEEGYKAKNSITGDEEQDNKIWENLQNRTSQIAQSSKHGNVNRMLNQYMNESFPDWQQGMVQDSLKIRQQNMKDAFPYERGKLLEQGKVEEANTFAYNAYKLGTITESERKQLVEESEGDSYILQSRRLLAEGKLDELGQKLQSIPVGTSVYQAEDIAKLESDYETTKKAMERLNETQIKEIYQTKLLGLYNKIKP